MQHRLVLPALVCVAFTLLGCAASEPPLDYEVTCTREGYPDSYTECVRRANEDYALCLDGCWTTYGLCDYCDLSTRNRCRRPPAQCLEHAYTFVPSPVTYQGLPEGCAAYYEHARACGEVIEGDPCETFVRTESRAAVAAYQCLAALPCGADGSECEPEPVQDLSERFCALLTSCPAELRAVLDAHDGWLRDSVVDALDRCAAVQGEERGACLIGWLDLITP